MEVVRSAEPDTEQVSIEKVEECIALLWKYDLQQWFEQYKNELEGCTGGRSEFQL